MGFTRTLVILSIGVVIPLVVFVIVLIGHTRSTPSRSASQTAAAYAILRRARQIRRVEIAALHIANDAANDAGYSSAVIALRKLGGDTAQGTDRDLRLASGVAAVMTCSSSASVSADHGRIGH